MDKVMRELLAAAPAPLFKPGDAAYAEWTSLPFVIAGMRLEPDLTTDIYTATEPPPPGAVELGRHNHDGIECIEWLFPKNGDMHWEYQLVRDTTVDGQIEVYGWVSEQTIVLRNAEMAERAAYAANQGK